MIVARSCGVTSGSSWSISVTLASHCVLVHCLPIGAVGAWQRLQTLSNTSLPGPSGSDCADALQEKRAMTIRLFILDRARRRGLYARVLRCEECCSQAHPNTRA